MQNQTLQTDSTKQTKPTESKLPNQTKPNLANQTHQIKPIDLVKAVNAWVRSAICKVFFCIFLKSVGVACKTSIWRARASLGGAATVNPS